jgi:hypothetical protein
VLDTLNVLHEVGLEGAARVSSFPLPHNAHGKVCRVPNYVVIEPPFRFGEVTSFQPEVIRANLELGRIVARYTKVGVLDAMSQRPRTPTQSDKAADDKWLESQKRDEIVRFLTDRAAYWRAQEPSPAPRPSYPPGANPAKRRDLDRQRVTPSIGSSPARYWRERYELLLREYQTSPVTPTLRRESRPA